MKNRRSLSNGKKEGSRGNSLRQSEERRRVEESAGGSVGSNCFISVLSLDFLISLSNIQGCLQQERLIFTDKGQSEHKPRTTEQRSRRKEYCSDSSLDNSSVLFLFWVSCTGSCFMSSCSQNNSLVINQLFVQTRHVENKDKISFPFPCLSDVSFLCVWLTHWLHLTRKQHQDCHQNSWVKILCERRRKIPFDDVNRRDSWHRSLNDKRIRERRRWEPQNLWEWQWLCSSWNDIRIHSLNIPLQEEEEMFEEKKEIISLFWFRNSSSETVFLSFSCWSSVMRDSGRWRKGWKKDVCISFLLMYLRHILRKIWLQLLSLRWDLRHKTQKDNSSLFKKQGSLCF